MTLIELYVNQIKSAGIDIAIGLVLEVLNSENIFVFEEILDLPIVQSVI